MSTSHIRCGNAAILNVAMNARMRYGNSAHVSDGRRQQHYVHKPLQIETWL